MYKNNIIQLKTDMIKNGIKGIKLAKVYDLPEFKILFKESYNLASSDIYQQSSNIIYEINNFIHKYGPHNILYWFNDFIKQETDLKVFSECDKNKKYNGILIDKITRKEETYVLDKSNSDRFFKVNLKNLNSKSFNYQFDNLTYAFYNENVKFSIFEPIFENKKFNNLIIKFPTISSRIVLDALILYSYIFEKVYVFKLKQDSFLKDSFIMYGLNKDLEKASNIKNKLNELINYKELANKNISYIFRSSDVFKKVEFYKSFIEFKRLVHMSVYVNLSLILYLIENEKDKDSHVSKEIKKLVGYL